MKSHDEEMREAKVEEIGRGWRKLAIIISVEGCEMIMQFIGNFQLSAACYQG